MTYNTIMKLATKLNNVIKQSEVAKVYDLSPSAIDQIARDCATAIDTPDIHYTDWKHMNEEELMIKIREARQALAIAYHYMKKQTPKETKELQYAYTL